MLQATFQHIHFATTDSTNLRAAELAKQHPGQRLVVTADVQTAGRGRYDRTWTSPPGGLWMSVALPLNKPAENDVGLRVAQALREALTELYPPLASRLHVKPPNDLLIDACKVAGILCEQKVVPGEPTATLLIVGIGLNANLDPAELGNDLRRPATALQQALGRPIDLSQLHDRLAQATLDAVLAHA